VAAIFAGEAIPRGPRDVLIAALQALGSEHPVKRQRAALGLTWASFSSL
jgi:hypothetical protein